MFASVVTISENISLKSGTHCMADFLFCFCKNLNGRDICSNLDQFVNLP